MAECPTCGDEFANEQGMKIHHKRTHGESIAGQLVVCDHCGGEYREERWKLDRNEGAYCTRECWRSSKEGVYEENIQREQVSRSDLAEDLTSVHDELGRTPTKDDMREHGKHSPATARRKFGTWNSFLEECGLLPDWYDTETLGKLYVDEHKSIEKVADELGCSQWAVWNQLHQSNIEVRSRTDREVPSGPDHPHWKGGRCDYYGPNWDTQREKALERDDRHCQRCGISSEEHIRSNNVGLDVHHIIPRREFTSDGILDYESANDLDNLVTLCRSCHRKWEGIPLRPQTASD